MVISAAARVATKIVAKAKTKKYFAVQKAKRIKKATIKRGKDTVNVQKKSEVKISKRPVEYFDDTTRDFKKVGEHATRTHTVTSSRKISPLITTKSELQHDPKTVWRGIPPQPLSIEGESSRETVVAVKGLVAKKFGERLRLVAYKKKTIGETGTPSGKGKEKYDPSGSGGISIEFNASTTAAFLRRQSGSRVMTATHPDTGELMRGKIHNFAWSPDYIEYPVPMTSTVFGIARNEAPRRIGPPGYATLVRPKKSLEVFKHTGMIKTGDVDSRGWKSFQFSGIRATERKRETRGVGILKTKESPDSAIRSNVYSLGTLTEDASTRHDIRPVLTIEHLMEKTTQRGLKKADREHLTFVLGGKDAYAWGRPTEKRIIGKSKKSLIGGRGYKIPNFEGGLQLFSIRIPGKKSRKKIKHATLPAFAATSAGFILYPGTEKKAKKKKKRGKR